MKAVRYSYHKSSTILHCSGAEETLISCLLPDTSMSTCYYLLVECRDPPDSTEYITQTPVIITTNTPLPNDMSGTESSTEDGGIPIAVVAGVFGATVVVIILLAIVLIVILLQKYKNSSVSSRCILTVNSNEPQTLVFGITAFVHTIF